MKLVNENGGTYHRAFRSQLVDIVITEKDKTHTDKFQAAVRYNKEILTPEWIFDSVEKGFALPTKPYQVKSLKVSTPTRTDQSIANFTSNDNTQYSEISRISVLGKRTSEMTTVNDTVSSNMSDTVQKKKTFISPEPPVSKESNSKELKSDGLKKSNTKGGYAHYLSTLEEICPRQAKKAGNFLDGFCIFLSGFSEEEKEKLKKILNAGGATRYDVFNEDVTHIIVGRLDDTELGVWRKTSSLTGRNLKQFNKFNFT